MLKYCKSSTQEFVSTHVQLKFVWLVERVNDSMSYKMI